MTNSYRGTARKVSPFLIVTCLAGLVGTASLADDTDAGRGWYAGVGTGLSGLTPDTDRAALDLEDDTSTALVGWMGRDVGRRLSLELGVADLGEAGISGNHTVGYRVASLGVLAHVVGDAGGIARRDGVSVYLRAGLSYIDNDSSLQLQRADDTAVWAGTGIEWPVGRGWGLRGELTRYDGDARAAWVGVYARSGTVGTRRDDGRLPPPRVPAGDGSSTVRSTPIGPSPSPSPAAPAVATPVPMPAPLPGPLPGPTLASEPVRPVGCVDATADEPRDERGCARFAGVLDRVEFIGATARLTPVAERALVRLAARLEGHPGTVVELRVHVAPMLTEAAALRLSRERAIAVARRLAQAGVPVPQLRARAFGDRQPLAATTGYPRARPAGRVEIGVVR